jgi:5-methyltetrahydropteroyltriglutamate--homocysteine methyltransferase
MIRATIAGSLPKPTWLAQPNVLYAPWRLDGALLGEGQDDAVRLWLGAQERAGLDILTDGEQRRRHYIWGFLQGLTGIDTTVLAERRSRGGRYAKATPVARIVDEVTWPGPVLVEALRFVKANTDRPVKVTLPGPMTAADSVADVHRGRADADPAMMFADLLNREARALAAAGADVIQLDEPCFNVYIDQVADWGIAAVERAFEGVTAKRALHVCYGYGIEAVKAWKASNRKWDHYFTTLPLIARSSVAQVSIETAAPDVDVACIEALRGKEVMLGVVSVSTDEIETPEAVARRLRHALAHSDPDHLIACTDCGMVPLDRRTAEGKLSALAAGARLVNRELGLV